MCGDEIQGLTLLQFTNLLTGVHGFVARDDEREEVIVAFRGSQQLPDMFTGTSSLSSNFLIRSS